MTKIIFIPFLIILKFINAQEDTSHHSILKQASAPALTTDLFTPRIPNTALEKYKCTSPYDFCVRASTVSLRAFSQEIIQEIVFGRLLNFHNSTTNTPYSSPEIISPPINYLSYVRFYNPLAQLLLSGFRLNDPSRDLLVDSCLQSLEFCYDIWNQKKTPKRSNKASGVQVESMPIDQKYTTTSSLQQTITSLQSQCSKKPISDPKVTFTPASPTIKSIESSLVIPDQKYKQTKKLNLEIKKLALSSLRTKGLDTPTQPQIIEEMELWDEYKTLLQNIAHITQDGEITQSDIISTLKRNVNLLLVPNNVMGSYPILDPESETYTIIDLLYKLSFFAIDFLKANDIDPNLKKVIQYLDPLKNLIYTAHQTLLMQGLLPTKEALENELNLLHYLFYFALTTMEQDGITLIDIYTEMDTWEPMLRNAVGFLGFSTKDLEVFDHDIFRLCARKN